MPFGAPGGAGGAAQGAGEERLDRSDGVDAHRRRRGGWKHRKKTREGLTIFQANVRKGGAATEAALRHAEQAGADVVLLQEPRVWWSAGQQAWIPRSWPTFEAFLPQGHKTVEMPRVITYVARHRKELQFVQRQDLLTESTPDVLVLEAQGVRGRSLRIVNVYSAPPGRTVRPGNGVRLLTRHQLEGDSHPCFVAGDFNAHNVLWSAPGSWDRATASGRYLAAWIRAGGWELGLEQGTVTRRGARGEQDTAIDLVLLSEAMLAQGWTHNCEVRADLTTGSDHLPVLSVLRPRFALTSSEASVRPFNLKRIDWERFDVALRQEQELVRAGSTAAHGTAMREERERSLDAAFAQLQTSVRRAMEASTPRCKGSAKGCEWWDDACDAAVREVRLAEVQLVLARAAGQGERRARRGVKAASKRLAKQVAVSKRRFFDARLNSLEGNAIFGAMRWSDGASRRYRSPPLRDEAGTVHVTHAQKVEVLRRVLLPAPEPVDLQLPDLEQPLAHTQPDRPLDREELREAIFGQAPNKAAGPDEIPFSVLRRAWGVLEEEMFSLFSQTLELGWHPRPLRSATLVAIPKNGKRDPSSPRSYRLIALLPTLGKTIEKVVAARLARLGLQKGWVASEQFGSICGRSTTDALLTLIHDIEAGWTHAPPRVATALAIDVRGAYDAVHWVRLVALLHERGVPLHLLRWLVGFLTGRSASLCLDGEMGNMGAVETGIPQGSPISPTLYVLFAATLHALFGPGAMDEELRRVRLISYVDDNLLYTIEESAAENVRLLRKAYEAAHGWARQNGMRFDSDKRVFAHFVAPRCTADCPRTLELLDGTVEAVRTDDSFRWLGVQLDPRLSFQAHVRAAAEKGKKAAGAMTMLMNTRKGMRVMDSRRLYVACVRAVMTYGSAAWWRGFTRMEPGRPHAEELHPDGSSAGRPPPDPPTLKTNPGSKKHARLLNSAQHVALRRALPAYRTTSQAALQIEASCPPMDIFLDATLDAAALRLTTLDEHHPLLRRVQILWASTGPVPDIGSSRALPPPVELCDARSAVRRPYSTRLTHLATRIPANIERAHDMLDSLRTVAGVHFGEWKDQRAASTSTDTMNVFTDGSMVTTAPQTRATGAGWVLARGGQVLEQGCTHTGANREVFDAEAIALAIGTKTGLQKAQLLGIKNVVTHTDNQAVLAALRTMRPRSSYSVFNWLTMFVGDFLALDPAMKISFQWVKGHVGVIGNVLADTQAGRGAERSDEGIPSHAEATSLATARRRVKDAAQMAWRKRWEQDRIRQATSTYFQHRQSPPSLQPSPLLSELRRPDFALLLQLRTGHGDFAEYHQRFAHEDADTTCICGSPFSRLHPLECEAFSPHHRLLINEDGRRMTADDLLNGRQGALALMAFARASKAFSANKRRTSVNS